MSTFYRDFQGPTAIEQSIEYCAKRARLGHNTRRMRVDDEWTRVYFAPDAIDIDRAQEAIDEDRR